MVSGFYFERMFKIHLNDPALAFDEIDHRAVLESLTGKKQLEFPVRQYIIKLSPISG
jgi:hypothetical protein